jgi:hypothetical protein
MRTALFNPLQGAMDQLIVAVVGKALCFAAGGLALLAAAQHCVAFVVFDFFAALHLVDNPLQGWMAQLIVAVVGEALCVAAGGIALLAAAAHGAALVVVGFFAAQRLECCSAPRAIGVALHLRVGVDSHLGGR